MRLLENANQWEDYKVELALEHGWNPANVQFGRGPQHYPCLLATTPTDSENFISCYVYLDEAKRLVEVAQRQEVAELRATPAPALSDAEDAIGYSGMPINILTGVESLSQDETQTSEELSPAAPPATTKPSQDTFNYSAAAHIITLLQILLDSGGISGLKEYEARYLRQLNRVEQVTAGRRSPELESEKYVMSTLFKPEPSDG